MVSGFFTTETTNSQLCSKHLPSTRSDKAPHSFHFSDGLLVVQIQPLWPFGEMGWGERREEEREEENAACTQLAVSFPVRTPGKDADGTRRLLSMGS